MAKLIELSDEEILEQLNQGNDVVELYNNGDGVSINYNLLNNRHIICANGFKSCEFNGCDVTYEFNRAGYVTTVYLTAIDGRILVLSGESFCRNAMCKLREINWMHPVIANWLSHPFK